MADIIESVDVAAPADVVFEDMTGRVQREWGGTLVEQQPRDRLVWRADSTGQIGLMTFRQRGPESTRIAVEIEEREPASSTALDGAHVRRDLARFKAGIERERVATGGARGEVVGARAGDARPPASPGSDAGLVEDRERMPEHGLPSQPPTR